MDQPARKRSWWRESAPRICLEVRRVETRPGKTYPKHPEALPVAWAW